MIKKILKFFIRIPVLIVLAIAILSWFGYSGYKQKAILAKADRYRTTVVDNGVVQQRITANGTLAPVSVVNVGTQVSGTVLRLHTDYNKQVKAGQVLLELDSALIAATIAQIEATLRSAEATQRLAESTMKRNKELVAKGFISPATLEQNQKEVEVASAQVSQVRSQLERERTNLQFTIIKSPIDGTVIDRKVDVGQTVAASFSTPTLFQIARDLQKMQIDTSVAEADVGRLRDEMPVTFTVDAHPDREFQGKVRMVRLNPTIQQNVVTYNVIVDVSNEDNLLKPGMTAQVSMVTATKSDVVRIPNAALRFKPPRDEKAEALKAAADKTKGTTAMAAAMTAPGAAMKKPPTKVYKTTPDGELIPIEIQTGIASNQFTEITAGDVKVGDKLVTRDTQDPTARK